MNAVWTSILLVGLGLLLINNPTLAFASIQSGSEKAIALCIKLWAIYSIWLGLLRILEDTGLDKKIAKKMDKLIVFLMGKTDKETKNAIAVNITSNLLGMGNACTPSGIKGMSGLDKGSKYITNAMAMFMILNVTSLQILPTTVIGLRETHNSINSGDIILPTLIATTITTLTGIIMIKICGKLFKDKTCDESKIIKQQVKGKLKWALIFYQ